MNRRRFALAATTAITALALGGSLTSCSGSNSGGGQTNADGSITINVLAYQQLRADIIAEQIPDFEAAMAEQGQNIKVNLVTDILTDSQFTTKITQEYNAGTAPDVVDMNANYQSGFAGAGYLLPLDDYLGDWSDWDSFYPSIKDAVLSPDGATYVLPHEAGVQSLFYRKDILEGLGIDTSQPETWDDLITRLKAITAATGEPSITLPAGTAWGGGSWGEGFGNIVAGTDSGIYNEDTGLWDVNSDGVKETFDLYATLVSDGLLPVQDLLNPSPWIATKYEAFVDGSTPISGQGSWGWRYDWGPDGSAPIEDVTTKVATWDFPALSSGAQPYSTTSVGNVWAISAKTEQADAAVAFAEWMTTGEALANQLVAVGSVSPREGMDDVAPYSDEAQLITAEQTLPTAKVVPFKDGVDQISQAVQTSTESILTGDADGEQATAEFVKEATDLLGASRVQS